MEQKLETDLLTKYPHDKYIWQFCEGFIKSNIAVAISKRKSFVRRILYEFPKDIILGIHYGFPLCCVWYYSVLQLSGVAAAAYDEIMKHKIHSKEYVICDKCYFTSKEYLQKLDKV